jgi:hypothetical protein
MIDYQLYSKQKLGKENLKFDFKEKPGLGGI